MRRTWRGVEGVKFTARQSPAHYPKSSAAAVLAVAADVHADMDYQSVVIRKHPRPSAKRNPESRYWRQFRHPVFIKEYAPVTSVHFSQARPHRYAVTAATRVQIYAPRTQKVAKTISRFKDVARSGHIRADGKLVVAGDDSGLVQVRTVHHFRLDVC